ncbi:MAG: hypothetical protein HFJ34_02385 [Clostridia bacterium]|nr:hypothetical protein [Clostridia bacterium]
MAFILIVTIAIYFILIAWTWQSLGFIEKTKKVGIILVGTILTYLITLTIFQTTKNQFTYENITMQKQVQNIIVAIFSGINGIIILPQIGKIIDKLKENEIEKPILVKRVVILVILFMLCLIFEIGYMKETQEGIWKVYQAMKQ